VLRHLHHRRFPAWVGHGLELGAPAADLAGREDRQRAALPHMGHGLAHPLEAAQRGELLKGVHADEAIAQGFELLQQEVGHHLQVRAHLAQHMHQRQPIDGAVGMVGHEDHGALLRDVEAIGRIHIQLELQVPEHRRHEVAVVFVLDGVVEPLQAL